MLVLDCIIIVLKNLYLLDFLKMYNGTDLGPLELKGRHMFSDPYTLCCVLRCFKCHTNPLSSWVLIVAAIFHRWMQLWRQGDRWQRPTSAALTPVHLLQLGADRAGMLPPVWRGPVLHPSSRPLSGTIQFLKILQCIVDCQSGFKYKIRFQKKNI